MVKYDWSLLSQDSNVNEAPPNEEKKVKYDWSLLDENDGAVPPKIRKQPTVEEHSPSVEGAKNIIEAQADDSNPDEHAKNNKTAAELGIPKFFVDMSPQAAQDDLFVKRYNEVIKKHPKLAEFFKDRNNASSVDLKDVEAAGRLAQYLWAVRKTKLDDPITAIGKRLGAIDDRARMIAGGWMMSMGEANPAEYWRTRENVRTNIQAERQKQYQDAMSQINKRVGVDLSIMEARKLRSKLSKARVAEIEAGTQEEILKNPNALTVYGTKQAQEGYEQFKREMPLVDPGTVAFYASEMVGATVEMVPALAASYVNPALGISIISSQVFGETYQAARRDGRGPREAMAEGIIKALVEGISEKIPLGILTRRLKDAGPAGRQLIKRAFQAMGAEGIQETFVEAFDIAYDAGILDKDEPILSWENFQKLRDAGIIGMGVGGKLSVLTSAPSWFLHRRAKQKFEDRLEEIKAGLAQNKEANKTANETLVNVVAEAQAMPVAERDEGVAKKLVELAAADSPGETVYIDVTDADSYFQEANIDPDEFFQSMDITEEEIQDARARGGALAVPTHKFITTEGISDHLAGLAKDIKMDPEGYTDREAEQLEAMEAQHLDKTIQELEMDVKQDRASSEQKVFEDVYKMVMDLGMTKLEAKSLASVYKAKFKTMADLDGKDPYQLWLDQKLTMQNRPAQDMRTDVNLDLMLNAARADPPKLKKYPVLDHLKKTGKIKTGSPLAKELGVMGVTARSNPGLFSTKGKWTDADTIVASEAQQSDELFGELGVSGEFIDQGEILRAIDAEARGQPLRSAEQQIRQEEWERSSEDIIRGLETMDIDINLTNEEIKDRLRDAYFNPEGKMLFSRAFHGSPHIFEEFETSFIGQGEGAQAFGWGLYFTNSAEIAEMYREKLARRKRAGDPEEVVLNIGGVERRFVEWDPHGLVDRSDMDYEIVREETENRMAFFVVDFLSSPTYPSLDRAMMDAIAMHEKTSIGDTSFEVWWHGDPNYKPDTGQKTFWAAEYANDEKWGKALFQRMKKEEKRERKILNEWWQGGIEHIPGSEGRVYNVDLSPPLDHYLDLDRSLDEQSAHVKEVLEPFLADLHLMEGPEMKGDLYNILREELVNRTMRVMRSVADNKNQRLEVDPDGKVFRVDLERLFRNLRVETGLSGHFVNWIRANYPGVETGMAPSDGSRFNPDKILSEYLFSIGIAGNKYYDGFTRSRQKGQAPLGDVVLDGGKLDGTTFSKTADPVTLNDEQFQELLWQFNADHDSRGRPQDPSETIEHLLNMYEGHLGQEEQSLEVAERNRAGFLDPDSPWRLREGQELPDAGKYTDSIQVVKNHIKFVEKLAEKIIEDPNVLQFEESTEGLNFVVFDDSLVSVESFYQSAALRDGETRNQREFNRIQKDAQTARRRAEMFGLSYKNSTPSVREIGFALQERSRRKHGTIERGDKSDTASSKIAEWMADEVEFEMDPGRADRSGAGWYSHKFQRALDELGRTFPELKGRNIKNSNLPGVQLLGNKKNARNFLTTLIALTSDGQKVFSNYALAGRVYDYFRENGTLKGFELESWRGESMRTNLVAVQKMLDDHGPENMHTVLMQENTVSELKASAKKLGFTLTAGYPADRVLPMAAIVLGPKLGAFYGNLMGAHGYLTMDRWWTRTFNRYRGSVIPQIPGARREGEFNVSDVSTTSKGKTKLKGLAAFKNKLGEKKKDILAGKEKMSDEEALFHVVEHAKKYADKNWKNGTALEKAANTIFKKAFSELEDQPYNTSDRGFMIDSVDKAQQVLKERGIEVSVADIQAILWYYEKRLYGELGSRQSADISYEEAAKRIVEEGFDVSEERIKQLQKEDSSGRARPSVQAVEQNVLRTPDGVSFPVDRNKDAANSEGDLVPVKELPKRSKKYGVGKEIGGAAYLHRGSVKELPSNIQKIIKGAKPPFAWAIAKYDPKTGNVSLLESKDFDIADEPTVGRSFLIKPNGETKIINPPSDPWIYHHKWLMVPEGYKKFSVEASRLRSRRWMSLPGIDYKRIGKKSFWETQVLPKMEPKGIDAQPESDTTQIKGTEATYEKVGEILREQGVTSVLDYGAGLGTGADIIRRILGGVHTDTLEPLPDKWASPNAVSYTNSSEIDQSYDAVVNLNVINVMEPALREQAISDMVDKLNVGGVAIIGTREWNSVKTPKNKTNAKETRAIWVKKKRDGKEVKVYQKGWLRKENHRELREYIQSIVGAGYSVEGLNNVADTAVKITKLEPTTYFQSFGWAREGLDIELNNWRGNMEAARNEERLPDYIPLGRTSNIFRIMGFDMKGVKIKASKFRRMKTQHPEVPAHVWDNLPEMIADPLFMFPATKTGEHDSWIVVLDAKSKSEDPRYDGQPVIVTVDRDGFEDRDGEKVPRHVITSVYGRSQDDAKKFIDDGNDWVSGRIQGFVRANLDVYARSERRLDELLSSTSVKPIPVPRSMAHRLREKRRVTDETQKSGRIITNNDVVNKYGRGLHQGQPDSLRPSQVDMRIRQMAFENDIRAGLITPESPNVDPDEVRAIQADMASGLKQGEQEEGPRGMFQISADRKNRVISLFEGADISTLMHESGHFFLEVMRDMYEGPNAPARITKDVHILFEWFGIKGWDELRTEHHEMFAENFEKYLFTGQAPTQELQSIFRSIADWLSGIYKSIKEIGITGIDMTPEVKGVMDRMLASDSEIAAAQETNRFMPAFKDAETAKMTSAEFDRYELQAKKMYETARERARIQLLKDISRQKTAEYKERLESVKNKVEEELTKDPTWRLLHFLKTGKFLDRETPEDTEHLKLNKAEVSEALGGDFQLSLLPRGLFSEDGTLSLSQAGALFNLNPEYILTTIMEMGTVRVNKNGDRVVKFPTFSQAVEKEAKRRLEEEEGLSLDENKLQEATVEALNNTDRAELLIMEMTHLRKLASGVLNRAAQRRIEEEGPGTIEDREAAIGDAEESLAVALENQGEQGIQSAALGVQLAEADQRVAKTERRKGASARARVRELTEEGGEGRKLDPALQIKPRVVREMARQFVQRMTIKQLNRLSKYHRDELKAGRNTELAIAERNYEKAATYKFQQVWNHFVFIEGQKVAKERDQGLKMFSRITKVKKPHKSTIENQYLAQAQTLLAAFDLGQTGADKDLARQEIARTGEMDENGDPVLSPIENWVEQIRPESNVVLPVSLVESQIDYNDMTIEQFRDLKDAVTSIAKNGREFSKEVKRVFDEEMDQLVGDIEANHTKLKPRKEYDTKKQKAADLLSGMAAWIRKAENIARELDGGINGPVTRAIIFPMAEAQSEEQRRQDLAAEKMRVITEMIKHRSNKWWKTVHKFSSGEYSMMEIIPMALNSGNLGNKDGLMNGARPIGDIELNEILSKLDESDWAFVQAVWDYIDTFQAEVFALEERMTGVAPSKVEAEPVIVNGVQVAKGGYYPIKFDPMRNNKAHKDLVDEQAKILKSGGHGRAATKHGHTIERRGSKDKAVHLSLNIFSNHIQEVIHDLSHREAVIQVGKVIGNNKFRQAVVEAKGQSFITAIDHWINHVAAGRVEPLDWVEKVARHTRVGISIAEMGFSLRTAAVQFFGLTQSIVRLETPGKAFDGEKWLAKGFSTFASKGGDWVFQLSPFMAARARSFDQNVADQLNKLKPGGKVLGVKLDSIRDVSFIMVQKMDLVVAMPTWIAAYEKCMAGEAEFDGMQATEEDAVRYADQTVRMSQGSGNPIDLSVMQSRSELHRIYTAFFTFFASHYQMMVEASKAYGRKPPSLGATLKLAKDYFYLSILPAIGSVWMLDGGPDDEEEWYEWAAKTVGGFTVGGIPIVRDVVQGAFSDFGYSGPPSQRMFKLLVIAMTSPSDGELSRYEAKQMAVVLGYFFKIPTRQAARTSDYMWRYMNGETSGGFDPYQALVTGFKK